MKTDGIININKPSGITSHDVVAKVRRRLGIKRVGHTGTLDPMAEGVLPVCIGRATRIMEYLEADVKTYECIMALGVETDTGDIWGNVVVEQKTAGRDVTEVEEALRAQIGLIHQVPPMYSARKVKGKKLYEYAREGKTVEVPGKDVYIFSLDHIGLKDDKWEGLPCYGFTVSCTKGTYVRTICTTAGESLGTGAVMAGLTRTSNGAFHIEDAVRLEDLVEMSDEEIDDVILPIDDPLEDLGMISLSSFDSRRMVTGLPVWQSRCRVEKAPAYMEKDFVLPLKDNIRKGYRVYGDPDGGGRRFLAVAMPTDDGENYKADKVFYRQ